MRSREVERVAGRSGGPWQRMVGGRPVPYITAWSQELPRPVSSTAADVEVRLVATDDGQFVYAPDHPADVTVEDGLVWLDRPSNPGVGTPRWADVHEARQRTAMVEHRCQVCAVRLPRPSADRPQVWLTSDTTAGDGRVPAGHHSTVDPATCGPCAKQAAVLCPHLTDVARLWLLVSAVDPTWAVQGTRFRVSADGHVSQEELVHANDEVAAQTILVRKHVALLRVVRVLSADEAHRLLDD